MNKDYKKLCPFKGWVLENFPFIEADFDAITNYELLCKIIEYLNKTSSQFNDMIDNINYLNSWFDNLDLQDEVNNKLDEMAESGELLQLISDFLPYVTPEMYGAKADGVTDDSSAFLNALNSGCVVTLNNEKTYKLASNIEPNKSFTLKGNKGKITGYAIINNYNSTIEDVIFEDIEKSAIIHKNNKLIVKNCIFNRTGINQETDVRYEGSGIFTSDNENLKELYVTNCTFKYCNSHGAIFCSQNNRIFIENNYFEKNYYRAIHLYGYPANSYLTSGVIKNNYIIDCGQPNTTGSGVGCNGIYSTHGREVDVINNIIKNSYENAIEGAYKSIIGNYIDTTNVNLVTHPTPSIEGIYTTNKCDCIIKDNILKNVKRRGITYSDPSGTITNNLLIENNIIDITEYNTVKDAIYINVSSCDNLHIIDNITEDSITVIHAKDTCTYSGDITLFSGSRIRVLSNYNQEYNYNKVFNDFTDWTYSNCTPAIVADATINNNVVSIPYQQYNRFISPQLPYYNKINGVIRLFCKGKFNIDIMDGNSYHTTLIAIDDADYTLHEILLADTGNGKTKKTLWFVCQSSSQIDIQSISINAQFK